MARYTIYRTDGRGDGSNVYSLRDTFNGMRSVFRYLIEEPYGTEILTKRIGPDVQPVRRFVRGSGNRIVEHIETKRLHYFGNAAVRREAAPDVSDSRMARGWK